MYSILNCMYVQQCFGSGFLFLILMDADPGLDQYVTILVSNIFRSIQIFIVTFFCTMQLEFLSLVLIKQWADSNPDPAKWGGSAGWILIRNYTVYRTSRIRIDDIPVMALILPMLKSWATWALEYLCEIKIFNKTLVIRRPLSSVLIKKFK